MARTLWRNVHMFLDLLEFRIENKKSFLGKTVLKMLSQKFLNRTSFVPTIQDKKRFYVLVLFLVDFSFCTFFKSSFVDTKNLFAHKSETTFQNSFPLHFFIVFLFITLGCLETCVNWVTKCVTAKIYPMKIQIIEIILIIEKVSVKFEFCFSFYVFKNVWSQTV